MKIRYILIAAACLFSAILAFFIISNWNKHILFLNSGETIEAGKAWVVFDEVYYEKGVGTLYTLKTSQVERIVSASFSSVGDWIIILENEMAARRGIFSLMVNQKAWLAVLSVICLICLIAFTRRFILRYSNKKQKTGDEPDSRFVHISPQAPDFTKVLLYFLNLYLMQAKAKKDDKYVYQQLETTGPLKTTVYEYKILKDGQSQSRRISMGRIGEDSGARSKCFYVIYDDHFVVKIPPEPITDFDEYIQSINDDRRIAEIIAPRECLVPKLSIVLKKIPAFAKFLDKSRDHDEKNCVNGLKSSPEFQDFLKIAGSFAFFMDLSQYFFLGQILNECHDTGGMIEKEFTKHQDLIWIPASFTDRYGENSTELCFELQKIFNLFDHQLNNNAIPAFEKKAWFNSIFSENDPAAGVARVPSEIAAVISQIRTRHSGTLNAFKNILQKKAREQSFNQNTARIQNICSRMLELLAWLFFKDVAIRDLKPDNILVAGDPSKYPQFLSTAADFELGLIDVEIAAFIGSKNKTIQQPKLGWTPYYGTPSHMLVNDVLKKLYEDVGYILKLQDWYAMVAMIYQSVTGEKLFVNTAAVMASLAKELPLHFGDHIKMTVFAKKASSRFWVTASSEFDVKLKENETLLRTVHLEIFKNVKKMFSAAEKSWPESMVWPQPEINSKISAYAVMQSMFRHIRNCMHNQNWEQEIVTSQPAFNGNAHPKEKTAVL